VRRELLNPSYFETMDQARTAAHIWRTDYNEVRPHSMLANKTPNEFAAAARMAPEADFPAIKTVYEPGEGHCCRIAA
jgi:putative transposase